MVSLRIWLRLGFESGLGYFMFSDLQHMMNRSIKMLKICCEGICHKSITSIARMHSQQVRSCHRLLEQPIPEDCHSKVNYLALNFQIEQNLGLFMLEYSITFTLDLQKPYLKIEGKFTLLLTTTVQKLHYITVENTFFLTNTKMHYNLRMHMNKSLVQS